MGLRQYGLNQVAGALLEAAIDEKNTLRSL
jgi:hypothetical protein